MQRDTWLGNPKAALRFRKQEHADKITVFVGSDFAGDPVSRKNTTGLVAQIGNHTVKSGSTLQSLTALSVGKAEFSTVVKGGRVWMAVDGDDFVCLADEDGLNHIDSLLFS